MWRTENKLVFKIVFLNIAKWLDKVCIMWPATNWNISHWHNISSQCSVSWSTLYCLTLNMRVPSHLGLTSSISWLLMPWLLTSTGHQQLWYIDCVEYVAPGITWGNILSTCVISMWGNGIKCNGLLLWQRSRPVYARTLLQTTFTIQISSC